MVDDTLPELLVLGCTSHSLALVASHASKRLPEGFEPMLRNLINYFANSPKRIAELKDIQPLAELKVHQMLQIVNTRWLSMEQEISRVLEQLNALVMFFTSYGLKDASGDKSSRDKAAIILSCLKEPLAKAFFNFLVFKLNKVNCLNLEFQSSETRIHKLSSSSRATMKSIMKSFVKNWHLREWRRFCHTHDLRLFQGNLRDFLWSQYRNTLAEIKGCNTLEWSQTI